MAAPIQIKKTNTYHWLDSSVHRDYFCIASIAISRTPSDFIPDDIERDFLFTAVENTPPTRKPISLCHELKEILTAAVNADAAKNATPSDFADQEKSLRLFNVPASACQAVMDRGKLCES